MREYLLVLLVAAGVTYLLSGLARRLAFRYNAVAMVRDRDVHTKPIPYFGGISMWAGSPRRLLVADQLPWLGGFELVSHDARVVLFAGGLICAVGVLDDMVELNALAKIAGQLLAAGVVVLNGVKVYWIPLPDAIVSLDEGSSIVVTVGVDLHLRERDQPHRRPGRPRGRRGRDRRGRLLHLRLSALLRAGAGAGHHVQPDHRGDGGGVPGLPALQHPPCPDVHGRLRRDAAGLPARHLDDQPHRPARPVPAEPPRGRTLSRPTCRCCCRSP